MPYQQLKLENQICFRLYTASRLVQKAYQPFFSKMKITYAQYLVLMVLWQEDNVPVSKITESLQLDTNTVTPLLQRMEKQGLITRAKGKKDTRQCFVSLSQEGKKLEEEAANIPSCMLGQLTSQGILQEDLFNLATLLDKINNAINNINK